MEKIFFASVEYHPYSDSYTISQEWSEADGGEEWGGNVMGYVENAIDSDYTVVKRIDLPSGIELDFGYATGRDFVFVLDEDGKPIEVYWLMEIDHIEMYGFRFKFDTDDNCNVLSAVWEVVDERREEADENIYFKTNPDGEAVFCVDLDTDNVKQLTGTCQFSVRGISVDRAMRRIRNWMDDVEVPENLYFDVSHCDGPDIVNEDEVCAAYNGILDDTSETDDNAVNVDDDGMYSIDELYMESAAEKLWESLCMNDEVGGVKVIYASEVESDGEYDDE